MNFNNAFESTFTTFEFIRPYWLLGIVIVLAFNLWRVQRNKYKNTNIIASHLSEHLVTLPETTKNNKLALSALLIIGFFALSGPSLRSVELPVYETQKAQVIAFDLSYSMYASDIKPSRLSQARYKAIDLLKQWNEGEKALIAYAGDAFTISPLTRDSNSIINHISNLSPRIMPVLGSRPDLALKKSISILKNAGYKKGHIVFITDGFDKDSLDKMKKMIANSDWMVSVLAVATPEGSPIKLPDGSLLKDTSDNIVVPKLEADLLYPITRINGGRYVTINAQGEDTLLLAKHYDTHHQRKESQQKAESKQLIDDGYWVSLLLLPLFLLLFRKGVFYIALLALTLPLSSPKVEASIWKNDQQNAYQSFQEGQYKEASKAFNNTEWKAAALFKNKQFKEAEAAYLAQNKAKPNDSETVYNLGNSQAMQQKYQEALDSFNEALKINPDFEQARINKKAVEDLLKQKKKEQEQKNKDKDKDKQQNKDQQKQDGQKGDKKPSDTQQDDQTSDQQNSSEQQNEQQDAKQGSSEQKENQSPSEEQDTKNQDKQADKSESEQAKEEQAKQQAAKEQAKSEDENNESAASEIPSDQQSNKEYEKLPNWLKNMPDDPALLLRNKMQLEYQKRAANQPVLQKNNGEIW